MEKPSRHFSATLCAILTAVVFTASAAGQTRMPTGIPAPDWNWEATVESVYGSQNYYTHWVDNTHPNATDSNNPSGSPERPRLTIPSLSNLAAGSVVQLRGGPYSGSVVTIEAAGTSQRPVFIRGASPDAQTTLNQQVRVRTASHLFIENIRWSGLSEVALTLRPGAMGEEIRHVVVRHNEVAGTGENTGSGAAIGMSNASYDVPVHHIVRAWNKVHDYGAWQDANENDKHALNIGTNVHDIWDLFNECYHNGGDGIGNGHDANHMTYRLFMGGNHLWANRENAIDLKEVHDVIISDNICHDYADTSSSEGAAIVIHYGPDTGQGIDNCWIINNQVYNSVIGIISTEAKRSWWIGNRVWNCDEGLAPDRGGGHLKLFNNTVDNCRVGIASDGIVDSLEIRNNIVHNISGDHLRIANSTVRANTTISNELYWDSDSSVRIVWGSTYTSVSAWLTGAKVGTASRQIDPRFGGTGVGGYHLLSTSPAIDTGFSLAAVDAEFRAMFGTSFLSDPFGTSRPAGVAIDVGAAEYRVDGGSQIPNPPGDARLN